MTVLQRWLGYPSRPLIIPSGLIIGYNGVSAPSGWSLFTAANNKYLNGTILDGEVGTTGGSATITSFTSGSGGSHYDGPGLAPAVGICSGSNSGCPTNCGGKSWNLGTYGDHNHTISGTYYPRISAVVLIQAGSGANLPNNGIMFSTVNNSYQTAFSSFNNSGLLYGYTSTGDLGEVPALSLLSGSMASHNHQTAVNTRQCTGVLTGTPTDVANGGAAHTHAISPSVAMNLYRTTLLPYLISNPNVATNLIGMWAGAGVPSGWELLSISGRFAQTTYSGDGSNLGNGTIDISGTSGNSSHDHPLSGTSGTSIVGNGYHTSLTHNHAASVASMTFTPPWYKIKFIKYIG
jgi:hypothetical protein